MAEAFKLQAQQQQHRKERLHPCVPKTQGRCALTFDLRGIFAKGAWLYYGLNHLDSSFLRTNF
jgi:hypothetical protein